MHPSGEARGDGPPSSQRYEQGALIGGKYELVRRLDEGGMGTVWVAYNVDLDTQVALKLIRPDVDAESTASRLLNEARILARLDHPAIVRVHDFGRTESGDPFIVMELLEGECLSDLAYRQGRFSAVGALRLLLPIAEALSVAHERGIVHRDLKPDNIFLAELGAGRVQPKVLDFGIAQAAVHGGTRLTREGMVLGSPDYMSPEQARGQRDLDPTSDIWSFCVVLYELLAGVVPFEGENYNATLSAIIEKQPEPITEAAAGDAALWQIMARGLEKDRERRWPSMRALGVELAGWLIAQGVYEDMARASLPSVWFGARNRQSDPFSVPPVALSLSSSAPPPRIGGTPTEVVRRPDPGSRRLPARTTGTIPVRLSTGGHGAVSFSSGPAGANPRRRLLALGFLTFAAGAGAALLWHSSGAVGVAPGSSAPGAGAPSAAAVPVPPPRAAPSTRAIPVPSVPATDGEVRDAGVESGAPQSRKAPAKPARRPVGAKPRFHRSHVRARPAPKSGRVGDLKVPY